MLYHQTKDILYVKEYLGHNKIETTLLYIQLAETIFKNLNDDFTVKLANTKEEIKACSKWVTSTSVKKMNFYTSENESNYRNRVKTGDLE